ncbi:MAG TPA: hypothetical protein VK638_57870, partial [Edaphobacter sp.]|nr:hypothetical protein [Edaphobacter sp.]
MKLHHYALATRATGEQGIAAFILGDTETAKSQVIRAWALSKAENDSAATAWVHCAVQPDRLYGLLVLSWVWSGIAASLILVCGLGEWAYLHHRPAHNQSILVAVSNVPRDAQVDLFSSGTLRSAGDETNELQQVSLPASIVHLHVTLPRFSQTGRYDVLVSKDKSGSRVVARGTGEAAEIAG